MSDGSKFLAWWVRENMNPNAYDDKDTAEYLASQCLSEAWGEGLSEAEVIAAAGGDLPAFMLSKLNGAV